MSLSLFLLIGIGLFSWYEAISSEVMKRIAAVMADHKLISKKDKGKFMKPLLVAHIPQLFCILCTSTSCGLAKGIYRGTGL